MNERGSKLRVSAVSYLNSVPLIWGMTRGPQREHVDLSYSIPSVCAREIEEGKADIGLVPVAEIARQGLEMIPGMGIACRGAVRSILLFSRVPWKEIRTLAADLSSRTSVQLARLILRERYGAEPLIIPQAPVLDEMLAHADAALIIGDPALRIDPEVSSIEWLDLGAEWLTLTGLPMVFATWAGKPGIAVDQIAELTSGSYEFGRARLDEIVDQEHRPRGISAQLAHRYLHHHIRYDIGPDETRGLETFLEMAELSGRLRLGRQARAAVAGRP